jgi:DNA-binding GntR family transcriptional regulator
MRNRNTLREHRAILDALSRHDAVEAGAAMGAHLDEVIAEIRRYAERRPELFEA